MYLFASDTALNVATAANVANSIIFTTLTASNELVPFKDVFYKKIDLNLGKGYAPMSPVLNRVIGNLQVEVLDAAVNPNYKVSVTVSGEPKSTYFTTWLPVVDMIPENYILTLPRLSDTVFNSNIINTSGEITVNITAKNVITGAQISKTVEHVSCYKNKKTTVRGSLNIPGGQAGSREFQIKINDTWNPNDNNIGF